MRLLDTETQELKEFMEDVPTYAILSHTWGGDEVTLQDLARRQPRNSTKDFAKIKRACALASDDGYRYIWIDTCCIDKTSSAELSEAINSMFRWYEEASVCYVYLSDLSTTQDDLSKDSLARCRWFQRGWTLQELVAPVEVQFYDRSWNQVGTKSSLFDWLSDITSIPQEVLFNPDEIYCLPVATKMSWAAMRQTTRVEDMAYCLLGLFDVHMPLLYGEGRKAFRRLQEEVLKKTDDLSLLAWCPEGPPMREEIREIWARSPAEFSWMVRGKIRIRVRGQFDNDIEITSKGLRVAKGLVTERFMYTSYILDLRCAAWPRPQEFLLGSQGIVQSDEPVFVSVGIRLRKFGPFMFVREVGGPPDRRLVFEETSLLFPGVTPHESWFVVTPPHPIWLQTEEKFLPFWILDDPALLPQRKFYREFRNYNNEPDIRFAGSANVTGIVGLRSATSRVEAILHDLWDEPRKTFLMGWVVPGRYRAFKVNVTLSMDDYSVSKILYGSGCPGLEIFVVIDPLSRNNRVSLVDTESDMGLELERAAKAVAESRDYNINWGFLARTTGPGSDELSIQEWVVTALFRLTPLFSETRLTTCLNFNIRRRRNTFIM